MPILDHFGILAPFYDMVFSAADRDRLQRLLRLPTTGSLLDVGGGTGRISQALMGLADHIVVLDESRPMLEEAGKKGLTSLEAHAEQMPFQDGSIDRILVVDAVHHVANIHQVLSEFCRLLRAPSSDGDGRGGRLVIEEPDIQTWKAKFIAVLERLFLMRSKFYSAEELVEYMADYGVQTQIVRENGMVWVIADKVG